MDNTRQAFSGQGFSVEPASQGRDVNRIYIRFSGAIYNRWDYDAESKRYFRFVDQENASSESMEIYAPLTDKLTEQRIAVENLVVILADYTYVVDPDIAEVYDINLIGSGPAFLFRDGKAYDIRWERRRPEDLLLLTDKDGAPVMLRPGQSWYEILHTTSTTSELEDAVRFQLWLPAKDAP
jgi:hypothetical protein